MPPVVATVAGAAIASSIGAVPLGLLVGSAASSLASIGLTSSIFGSLVGGVFTFAANTALSGLGAKKQRGSGLGASGNADQGLRQIVRLSTDTQKIIYGRARIGGTLAYVETYPTAPDSDGVSQTGDNLFLHMVIMHCGHEIDAIEQVYLDDDLVTLDANGFVNESPYKRDGKSYVRIRHQLGSDTQIANPLLVAECANWTTDHRLRGIAYSYIRLQWNPDVFTNGIPTLNVVLRGKKVFDPRNSSTVWSSNAALCVRDYLISRDLSGRPYGFGASNTEIDDTFTIAAANICDENITKLDSSTIKRYTIDGIVDTANAPLSNLEDMLSAMVGTVTTPRGVFRIYAGAYDTPETTVIDESWLSGDLVSTNTIERQQLFNAVRGRYVSPNKKWQTDDFPPITSALFEAQDNNERIFTEIDLPYTTDPEAAQRIAKIILFKTREQISVTMPCNYKALQFSVWDVVRLTNATRGWNQKLFRIVNFTFNIKEGIVLQLREESSASYNWLASDAAAIASAPDTDLPSPTLVEVPSGVSYDSRGVTTVGGDTVYNLVLKWSAYNNVYVTNGGQFEIQFKLSSDTEWRPSFFVEGSATVADIPNSSPNTPYDLRIRAVNILGARSNWVTIEDAQIGSSGGILFTLDWGSVANPVSHFIDWGFVDTTPTSFNDWGSAT